MHLCRNTPTPLVKEAFARFDDRVKQCFSECTVVDASVSTWQQAQLCLKRGGGGGGGGGLRAWMTLAITPSVVSTEGMWFRAIISSGMFF